MVSCLSCFLSFFLFFFKLAVISVIPVNVSETFVADSDFVLFSCLVLLRYFHANNCVFVSFFEKSFYQKFVHLGVFVFVSD